METYDKPLIKYDLLSVEALDKMHTCLDLLLEQHYIEYKGSLKETYLNTIGIYNLERDNKDMWKMVWNHDILSLFQMEQQSGIQGIALTHPESVDDLATLNSVIRLMAQEKGAEQPLNKFARFKEDISQWYQEMDDYGLTKEEQKLLEPIIKLSYGICESQEGFMQLVQMPECGGFDLTWADKLRKSIAKKNPAAYEELQREYFKTVKEKGLSQNLCNYVWNVLVATSRGYGFNKSHTLAYSLIALQEMNLAYRTPLIFWNCACLISDSGGNEIEDNEEDEILDETDYVNYDTCFDELDEVEEDDEDDDDEEVQSTKKKSKKNKSTKYGKIATAIGQMQANGVKIFPPDINKSSYTFHPDPIENKIIYGIKGITKIGDDLVSQIINNQPYTSIEDFTSKVKVNKTQVVNLIKSGAFDFLGDRKEVMYQYLESIADKKKRITLQNMQMLIKYNMIPSDLDYEKKVFNFNKYLKKHKKDIYYEIDEIAYRFYEQHYDIDKIRFINSQMYVEQSDWDKVYKSEMDPVRSWMKTNQEEILNNLNQTLVQEMVHKYAEGSLSKWEMDSVSFYYHEHELAHLNKVVYDIKDYNKLPEEPQIVDYFNIKGKKFPKFKLTRIAGTVLDKDKNKNLITVLTDTGVVKVKVYKPQFTKYDKQISEKGADGKKHVIEKSWFSRGNKLIITGIRRGDNFIPKVYKNSDYKNPFMIIDEITEDGLVKGREERVEA